MYWTKVEGRSFMGYIMGGVAQRPPRARCSRKEMQQPSLFEKFVTEGNEIVDELGKKRER